MDGLFAGIIVIEVLRAWDQVDGHALLRFGIVALCGLGLILVARWRLR